MWKNSSVILLSSTLLSIYGCSTISNDMSGTWSLTRIDGKDIHQSHVLLTIDMAHSKLSGFDACNHIHGQLIQTANNKIRIPILMSTRMACLDKSQAQISKMVHRVLKEEFTLHKEKTNSISLKSTHHTLILLPH